MDETIERRSGIVDRRGFFSVEETNSGPKQRPAHDYDLTVAAREGYLYVLLRTVSMTPDQYREAFVELRQRIDAKRAKRLMFEYETPLPLAGEKTYQLVYELAKTMPGTKIAVVALHAMHLLSVDIVASVARDTGRELAFFATPERAETWLRKG